jgi:heme/copper-type cytochrome/quinol oxidase subunit 4
MSASVRSVLAVWALLMLSTAASTWGFSRPVLAPTVSTVAVMAIAAIKVALIMAYFMELRHAPLGWRLAGMIWAAAAASAVLIIYLA